MQNLYSELNKYSDTLFPGTPANPKLLYGALKAIILRAKRDFLNKPYGRDINSVNIWIPGYKLLICGIPKIATTTLMHELVFNNALNKDVKMQTGSLANLLERRPELNNYYKVSFVRNPYSRVVSVYRSKICAQKPFHVASIFIRYKGLRHNMPFKDFVYWLCQSSEGDDSTADRHWISQYQFIRNEGRWMIDYIARFENLKEDWNQICDKLDINPPELHNYSLKTSRSPTSYRAYYSSDLQELIAERYSEDIRLLGYEF